MHECWPKIKKNESSRLASNCKSIKNSKQREFKPERYKVHNVLTISKELGQGGIKPWQCAQTPLHAQGLSFDELMNGGGANIESKKGMAIKRVWSTNNPVESAWALKICFVY